MRLFIHRKDDRVFRRVQTLYMTSEEVRVTPHSFVVFE
jgi:hypothetical protein